MKRLLYIAAIFLGGLYSCKDEVKWVPDDYHKGAHEIPSGEYVTDRSFKMVAYYAEANEPDSIEMEKFKMITHLHYAFAYPNADGTIQPLIKPQNFAKIMQRAKENGVKRAVSFAGSQAIYSAIAADSVLRSKFIDNIVTFALKYDLDGIDIDWEYPNAGLSNDITFEKFMKELSGKLHRYHLYLSAAVTAGLFAGDVRDGITPGAVEAMDFVNLMAYDAKGLDPQEPNHHSTYVIAQKVMDAWLNIKGLPKEKAVLGFPAYGKTADPTPLAMSYRELLKNGAKPLLNSATVITGNRTDIYYYNSLDVVKLKAQLAKDNANGLMVWELYQDANGPNSMVKAAYDVIK
ncbi:glycoside hydrolase family 18 protein [Desertivirga xinjiangensis]|uniref:glycoside hydrolase family 18 protein n=1 Tax=Desertivirga xinjiangensis TaxID=539206 RepID=UPI002108B556|nr:glycoside hydrolase family 18 protein [Pedobacter xinjiangensis]